MQLSRSRLATFRPPVQQSDRAGEPSRPETTRQTPQSPRAGARQASGRAPLDELVARCIGRRNKQLYSSGRSGGRNPGRDSHRCGGSAELRPRPEPSRSGDRAITLAARLSATTAPHGCWQQSTRLPPEPTYTKRWIGPRPASRLGSADHLAVDGVRRRSGGPGRVGRSADGGGAGGSAYWLTDEGVAGRRTR